MASQSSTPNRKSLLLDTPFDVFDMICKHVATDHRALASLALVNPACNENARRYQFNNIRIDFRHGGIFARDILEAIEREAENLAVLKPLGDCVLRLEVGSYGEVSSNGEVINRYRTSSERNYWPTALRVIPSLIYLRSLCITGSWSNLQGGLMNCLGRLSSLRELELNAVFTVEPELAAIPRSCPLAHLMILSIETTFDITRGHPEGDLSSFFQTILALYCSDVQKLTLSHGIRGDKGQSLALSFDMKFPNLKKLYIAQTTRLDRQALKCLLQEKLISMRLSSFDIDTCQVLSEIGQLRDLKSVHFQVHTQGELPPVDFIEANTQVEFITVRNCNDLFIRRLLQSLHTHKSIYGLSLGWSSSWGWQAASEETLQELSRLPSLTWLEINSLNHISTDRATNHDILRSCLSRIPCLTSLWFEHSPKSLFLDGPQWRPFWESEGMEKCVKAYFEEIPTLQYIALYDTLFRRPPTSDHPPLMVT